MNHAASAGPLTTGTPTCSVERSQVNSWLCGLASLAVVPIVALGLAARAGLPDPMGVRVIFLSAGIAWFIANAHHLLQYLVVNRQTCILGHPCTLLMAVLVGVVASGWLAGAAAGVILAGLGVPLFVWTLVCIVRYETWVSIGTLAVLGPATGLALAGVVWGSGYQSPVFVEGMVHGQAHTDTLFHASIANMIRTYHVASTGLEGTPYLPYHTGSHFVMAITGELIGATSIDTYNLAYPIIWAPLLVYTALVSGIGLGRHGEQRASARAHFVSWLLVMTAVIGLLPLEAQKDVGLYLPINSFVSESMCIGLTMAVLGLGVSLSGLRSMIEQRSLSRVDQVAAATLLPAWLFLAGLMKMSLVPVFGAAAGYTLLRTQRLRGNLLAWTSLGFAFLSSVGVAWLVLFPPPQWTLSGSDALLHPLHFLKMCVQKVWWPYFFLAECSWLILAVWLRLRREKVTDFTSLAERTRAGAMLDLEILAIVAIVGFLPCLFVFMVGGVQSYFHDIQAWVAIVIAVGALGTAAVSSGDLPSPWEGRLTPTGALGALFVLPALCGMMLFNGTERLRDCVGSILTARGTVDVNVRRDVKTLLGGGRLAMQGGDSGRAALVEAMREIDRLPRAEKARTLLYIPRQNRYYWDFFPRGQERRMNPFVGPALSGVALLDGLPAPEKEFAWQWYGFDRYKLPTAEVVRPAVEEYQSELLKRAVALGCGRVIVLEAAGGGVRLSELCAPGYVPLWGQGRMFAPATSASVQGE